MGKAKSHLDDIVKVAEKLFFEYDYDSVSMNDIAKKLSITKAALYYHFKNKEELFFHIIDRDLHYFRERIEKLMDSEDFRKSDIEKKTEKVIAFFFQAIVNKINPLNVISKASSRDRKGFLKALGKMKEKVLGEFFELMAPISQEIIDRKKIKNILDKNEVSMLLLSLINPFFYEIFVHPSKKISADIVAKKVCSFVFNK